MRKIQKKMQEVGLTSNDLSQSLKTNLAKWEKGLDELDNLKKQYANTPDDHAEKEEMGEALEELTVLIEQGDGELVEKFDKWYVKRDYYADKMANMKAKTPAKNKPQAVAAAPVQQAPVVVAPASPVVVQAPPQEEKKKGESWFLWGGLALLGLIVGVNVMNNKN